MSIAKKEKRAIEYLKAFEPKDEPYYLCYSGGKDSDCIRILAELAGVKTDIKHNLTINKIITKPPKSHSGLKNCLAYVLRSDKTEQTLTAITGPYHHK